MLIANKYTSTILSTAINLKELFTPQKYDFYMSESLLENIRDINFKDLYIL